MTNATPKEWEKIRGMDPEKHQRIMNAAMGEFSKGYKTAGTDDIVRQAGISKGLLFHYFGTKRKLFRYVIEHALEAVKKEYFPMLSTRHSDLLEKIWQLALLKRELCARYPAIFEFLTAAYYEMEEEPNNDFRLQFQQVQTTAYQLIYDDAALAPMREGVDEKMAANIVRWTLDGFSRELTAHQKPFSQLVEQYDDYLTETKRYLDLLRFLLYGDQTAPAG